VAFQTREYGSAQSYRDFAPQKQAEEDIEKLWD